MLLNLFAHWMDALFVLLMILGALRAAVKLSTRASVTLAKLTSGGLVKRWAIGSGGLPSPIREN
jgi:hypothetical protein